MPSGYVLPAMIRSWVFLLFAALLIAQQPPAPAQKPGQVDGVVTNSATGDPVKKANVILQGTARYTAVTDAAGHFHIDNVTPGQYQPMATKDGFIPPLGDRWPAGAKLVSVAEEQEVKDLVVKLVPLATVNGRVLDEDGDPMMGAQVQALRYVYRQAGTRQLQPAGFASSNDLGEFQLLDLEPGRYYFRVTVQRRMSRHASKTRSAAPEQAYPDTYYPGAAQPAQATAAQLAPGAQLTNIDFRLRKTAAYRVRGKIVDGRTGQPVHTRGMFQVMPRDRSFFGGGSFVPIQQDGTFAARGVVSGSYLVSGQTEGLNCEQPVNVADQDVDDVMLVCNPPLQLSGTIRVDGTPPANIGTMQVNLMAADNRGGASNAADKDGNFSMQILPGVYQAQVFGAAGVYVKSMHFGDQDVSGGQIDLTQQTSGALNIVLGTDVAEIQGTVQNENGEPAAGAVITIWPDEQHQGRLDMHHQLVSDQSGKFDYQDFAPGEYKAIAWESGDPEMLGSQEFRKEFESKAAPVSVQPGGHSSVQLKVVPAADIEAAKNKIQ